jgi:ketosteroid isomerase-like protein
MRLSFDVIVILTISLVAVALERPSSAPAKQVAAHVGTATEHSDTELLVQMEKDLFQAKMTTNPDVIEKFLSDDWVNISPTGREGSKAGLVQHLRQHPGELPPFTGQQQDLQVYVFGNAGVATYVEELTAKPDQHLPWSKVQTDGTDVFVKESGTWKLRLSRGSPHVQQ